MKNDTQNNYEIERKYLIDYPDQEALQALSGARVCDIVQTYLITEKGELRVRKWTENGTTTYFSTYKEKTAGTLRRLEIEHVISEEEYNTLLQTADPSMNPLCKRRYSIPYCEHIVEIDIYPFFNDRAIMEIELPSEDTPVTLPPFVTVIREVTGEKEYKNPVLARTYKSL